MVESVSALKQVSVQPQSSSNSQPPVTKPQTASFDNCTINNDKNSFLKEYINLRLAKENVKLPEGWEINVKSPEKLSKEDSKLLRDVRVNTYKARVDDLFNLLEKPKSYVFQRIGEMKISDEEKSNLKLLKEKYDNYYTIELKAGDKTYDLRNLSDEDKKEISDKNPELAQFLEQEQESIEGISKKFSSAEIKKEVLADSGKSSRYGAYALVPVLAVLGLKAVLEQKKVAKAIKADEVKYLKEQIEILNNGNPLKNLMKKGGLKEYVKSMKDGKNNWFSVLALAFAGSWDDCLGSVKDFFQDQDNFGTKKATAIMLPSMVMGVLTSVVIAPLMDSMVNFSRAKSYIAKKAKAGNVPTDIKLPNIPTDKKTKAAFIAGTTLLGILFSVFCSGSSWTSEILTYLQLKNNKKALKENNVLNDEEDKNSSTKNNFMAYEAYSGKLNGILAADPISGAAFGGAGWLTSANPYINSAATATCGCIETITASVEQLTKDGTRKKRIDKDKEKLLNSVKV